MSLSKKKYGKLVVTEGPTSNRYKCRCVCGAIVFLTQEDLLVHKVITCSQKCKDNYCKFRSCPGRVYKRKLCHKHYVIAPRPLRDSVRSLEDYDYLDRLSPEELRWHEKFNREYYYGQPIKRPSSIHPVKFKKELNKNEYIRRHVFDLTKAKPITDKYTNKVESFEDAVLSKIDLEKKFKK